MPSIPSILILEVITVLNSNYLIQRLQYDLNSAARLVSLSREAVHITPLLTVLHWLPPCGATHQLKDSIICIQDNGLAPAHLSDLLVLLVF